MMKFRFIVIGIISVIFFTTSASLAVTAINKSGVSSPSSAPSSVKIMKTTVIATKFENNTLYVANGQKYDLRNVKVNNYTANTKNKTDKNMIAELTYVNDVLKEVTIR